MTPMGDVEAGRGGVGGGDGRPLGPDGRPLPGPAQASGQLNLFIPLSQSLDQSLVFPS